MCVVDAKFDIVIDLGAVQQARDEYENSNRLYWTVILQWPCAVMDITYHTEKGRVHHII